MRRPWPALSRSATGKKLDDNKIVVALKKQMFLNLLQSPAVVLSGADA
jgi:hypothetical protein